MAQGMIMRRGGAAAAGLPKFTYTGTYSLIDDGNKDWRIKFLSSGTLTFLKTVTIDAFYVGGGGAGGAGTDAGAGGGGYTATQQGLVLIKNTGYPIIIGAGGETGSNGGTSSAFSYSALGGYRGNITAARGGGGGSGGAAAYNVGGSNGANGGGANGGLGQGTTTREFGESSGDLYAGGGGGNGGTTNYGGAGGGGAGYSSVDSNHPINGWPNYGGGGGATYTGTPGQGGSGIVVIRNHRAA